MYCVLRDDISSHSPTFGTAGRILTRRETGTLGSPLHLDLLSFVISPEPEPDSVFGSMTMLCEKRRPGFQSPPSPWLDPSARSLAR